MNQEHPYEFAFFDELLKLCKKYGVEIAADVIVHDDFPEEAIPTICFEFHDCEWISDDNIIEYCRCESFKKFDDQNENIIFNGNVDGDSNSYYLSELFLKYKK